MADPIIAMRAVADRLDQTGWEYAFVGGAIVPLLLDHPNLYPARPTDDVDVIIGLVTDLRYSDVEARMRALGFQHDMRPGAPKCRWLLNEELVVDVMPADGEQLGLNTRWFAEALASASDRVIRGDVRLRIISAPTFIALKLAAFADRGDRDYYGSHDLEDLLTVIDGRDRIVDEIASASAALRDYVRSELRSLLAVGDFREALSGALPPDGASQARLPLLRAKLGRICELP